MTVKEEVISQFFFQFQDKYLKFYFYQMENDFGQDSGSDIDADSNDTDQLFGELAEQTESIDTNLNIKSLLSLQESKIDETNHFNKQSKTGLLIQVDILHK